MKKAILLLFLLILPSAYATTTVLVSNQTMAASNGNWFGTATFNGVLDINGNQYERWANKFPSLQSTLETINCSFNLKVTFAGDSGDKLFDWSHVNGTGVGQPGGNPGPDFILCRDATNIYLEDNDGACGGANAVDLGAIDTGTDHFYRINLPGNSKACGWRDESFKGCTIPVSSGNKTFIGFKANGAIEMDIDNFYCTLEDETGSIPDTTPPEITYYNLTNENGCENWNTNKNNPCTTSSVVPTIQFNTSENAWCRIGINNTNLTTMGISRNCTGAMAGEGGTSHRCTLTSQDELTNEDSFIYLSCKDGSENQNASSTSGALALNITGLEATAKSSIELGIRNSLSNSYTLFTGQKIYARNSANTQSVGTFDKVVKKLSKIWAFNRIGASDSHVNMFNITPVLYTLELANKTSTNITNQVELLLNATR